MTELAAAGFELSALTCSNHSNYPGTFTTDTATGTANISLIAGADVHCVYVNVPVAVPGSYNLVVVKSAEPHSPLLFDFTIAGGMVPVNFQLADPAATSHNEVLAVNTAYTLTEAAVAGWDTTLACDDPAVAVAGATATLAANSIADGSTVTCTYTNVQRATVTIAKQATEAAPGSFAFASTLPGAANFNLTSSTQNVVTGVVPGSYTVTEAAQAGYVLQNIACSDAAGASSFVTDLNSGTATLQVAPGADLTCTFVNGQLGNLVIVKDAAPNGPQSFAFEIGIGNFSLVDDGAPAGNCAAPGTNTICFQNITPGDYPTREIVPSGWRVASIVCAGGSAVVDLATATVTPTVPPGGTVTCTFTDVPSTFTLNVVKNTQPDSPVAFDFTLLRNGNPLSTFQLSDPASPSTSVVLSTGSTYVLSETPNAAWNTTVTCSDPAAVVNEAQVTLPPTIPNGATITCTYQNAQIVGATFSLTVVKDAQPDSGLAFGFTLLQNGLPSNTFELADPATPSIGLSLPAGSTYVLSENPVQFWNASVTCSDPGAIVNGAQVTLPNTITAGGAIVCTYVNTFVAPSQPSVIPALDAWKLWLLAFGLATVGGVWLRRRGVQ